MSQHVHQSTYITARITQHAYRGAHTRARVPQHAYHSKYIGARIITVRLSQHAYHSTRITARVSQHACHSTHKSTAGSEQSRGLTTLRYSTGLQSFRSFHTHAAASQECEGQQHQRQPAAAILARTCAHWRHCGLHLRPVPVLAALASTA